MIVHTHDLQNGEFVTGALYSWYEEYLVLDFSAPGIRTSVTCVAPSPRSVFRFY